MIKFNFNPTTYTHSLLFIFPLLHFFFIFFTFKMLHSVYDGIKGYKIKEPSFAHYKLKPSSFINKRREFKFKVMMVVITLYRNRSWVCRNCDSSPVLIIKKKHIYVLHSNNLKGSFLLLSLHDTKLKYTIWLKNIEWTVCMDF